MTESEKKIVLEEISVIHLSLELLQKEGKIGSWGFGLKSYSNGIWDPKRKKTMAEYIKAVFSLRRMKDKSGFRFGFTLQCEVQNPQNSHKIELVTKEYQYAEPAFHVLDPVKYDEFRWELDKLASIIGILDLRNFPKNPRIDGSGTSPLKIIN